MALFGSPIDWGVDVTYDTGVALLRLMLATDLQV